jgi:hypothetical protein
MEVSPVSFQATKKSHKDAVFALLEGINGEELDYFNENPSNKLKSFERSDMELYEENGELRLVSDPMNVDYSWRDVPGSKRYELLASLAETGDLEVSWSSTYESGFGGRARVSRELGLSDGELDENFRKDLQEVVEYLEQREE